MIPTGSNGNNSNGNNSSGNGSVDVDGQTHVSLPDGFPSDIPLVGTDYAYALKVSETGWGVFVRVDDADEGFAKASDLLVNEGGFVKNDEVGGSGDGVSIGVFSSDKYGIQLTSSNKSDFGPVVEYVVTEK
jgi:hypothetical protein